jgi:uracil-DNA glycosylase family 4
LKDTYGLPVYQEQVMYILHMAGIPWKTVDYVRKIISKSQGVEQMLKFREMYVKGCLEKRLLNEEEANKVFDIIAHFGSYGFNKSHCVAYSMLTYYTAWLKKYYPKEYFCAYLMHRGEEELVLRELKKLGVSVKLPHVNVSGVSWSMKNGEIVCGLSVIKGLGEKISSKIVEERKSRGEYTSIENFTRRAGVGKSVLELLSKAGALDGLILEDTSAYLFGKTDPDVPKVSEKEKLSNIVEVMPFLQMLDVFGGYRRLVEHLKSIWSAEDGRITKSVEVDASNPFQEKLYLFGQLGAIKYGYRENVREVAGTADNLGAAYVYLTDDDGHIMVVIPEEEVLNNQEYVASLGGKVVIVESFQKRRRSNVVSTKIWKMEEVSKGNISGLPVNFFQEVGAGIMNALKELKCISRCSAVGNYVPIEVGKYRIMIAGEAPGTEEDKVGRPFVGRAGKLLFDALGSYGLVREIFCISNVMKCLPSATGKIASQSDASKCFSNFLKREIEIVKPTVILCLGGTFAKLLGKKNITSCAGTVEWNENVGCFVVYCLHPASVLYHRENEKMFLLGIENFARLLCKEELIKVEAGEMYADKSEEQEYEYEYEE